MQEDNWTKRNVEQEEIREEEFLMENEQEGVRNNENQEEELDYSDRINLKWFIPAIILIWLCYSFPPIYLSFKHPALTAIGLAVICGIPIMFAFAGISSFDDFLGIFVTNKIKTSPVQTIIPFVLCLILIFVFVEHFRGVIDKKIDQEGIYTQAEILDGEVTLHRGRGHSYERAKLVVLYTDNHQKKHQFDLDVPSDDFSNFYEGQSIEVKYLPDNPEVVRLMYGDNVKKFKHIEHRNLVYKDFAEILSRVEDEAKLLEYLNSISFGWEIEREDGNSIFNNTEKKESFTFSSQNLKFKIFNSRDKFLPKELILREAYIKLQGQAVCLIETKEFVIIDMVELDPALGALNPKMFLSKTDTEFVHIFMLMPVNYYDEFLEKGTPLD